MEIACRGESGVCARRRKSGRQENVGTKFSNLTTRTKLGLTESRHATRYVCMHVHTHTHMYASTRAQPILFPILYPFPVYTFCRDGRRPMSHSTPLKCPRKSFSSPLANVFPRTFSPVFFQAFRTGIFRRNISDRPILYDYYYHRRFAVQPGNPHFHERRITTAT